MVIEPNTDWRKKFESMKGKYHKQKQPFKSYKLWLAMAFSVKARVPKQNQTEIQFHNKNDLIN